MAFRMYFAQQYLIDSSVKLTMRVNGKDVSYLFIPASLLSPKNLAEAKRRLIDGYAYSLRKKIMEALRSHTVLRAQVASIPQEAFFEHFEQQGIRAELDRIAKRRRSNRRLTALATTLRQLQREYDALAAQKAREPQEEEG